MIPLLEAMNIAPQSTLQNLVKQSSTTGLFLEFGVYSGNSIKIIAENTPNIVYGFDSFEGLPEDWYIHSKGHFACDPPIDVPNNVELVIGWFDKTLPEFVRSHLESVSFMHIDCDLYSSTKCIFDNFKHKFVDGSIIVFDEIYGYTGYEHHEYKAFQEFLEETQFGWECIGKYSLHQAGFKLHV